MSYRKDEDKKREGKNHLFGVGSHPLPGRRKPTCPKSWVGARF